MDDLIDHSHGAQNVSMIYGKYVIHTGELGYKGKRMVCTKE